MLALLAVDGGHLGAGAVGLALARRWSDCGERVLFVDADTSGSRLAERLGTVERAEYSPATRGLPSLVTARRPLTLESVAPHCYSMGEGALWTLFGPYHPDGGGHAAGWLAGQVGELEDIDRERTVVVASSIRPGGTTLDPLLRVAHVVAVLAPVETREHAKRLWEMLRDAGLLGFERAHRALIVEGDSALDDDELRAEAGMHVAGKLPVVDDDRVLRLQNGRRDRTFSRQLDSIAARLLALSAQEQDTSRRQLALVAHPGPAAGSELSPSPAAGARPDPGPSPSSVGNGSESRQPHQSPEPGPSPSSVGNGSESRQPHQSPEPGPSPSSVGNGSESRQPHQSPEPSSAPEPSVVAHSSGAPTMPEPSQDLPAETRSQGRLWG